MVKTLQHKKQFYENVKTNGLFTRKSHVLSTKKAKLSA